MKRIAGLIVVAAVSLLAGIAYGHYRATSGVRAAIENIFVETSALNLNLHITLLERLRSGNQDKAVELLETSADLELAQLAAHSKFILDRRPEDVLSGIRKATEYRTRYPGHKVNEKLAGSVSKGLELAR